MEVAMLAKMLLEAEHLHGGYEPHAPKHHWSDWYAAFLVAREQGAAPDEAADDARRHTERVAPATTPPGAS